MAESSFKLTYSTMFNPPEELHTRYDQALIQVKANLGKEHGMLIDGKDHFSAEKFEDRSPADTDLVLGIFQKGTAADAQLALDAARKASSMWSHTPWQEQVRLVRRAAEIMDERTFEMGVIVSLSTETDTFPYPPPDPSAGRGRITPHPIVRSTAVLFSGIPGTPPRIFFPAPVLHPE